MGYNKINVEKLIDGIKDTGTEVDISPVGASSKTIAGLEAEISVTFPDDLRKFLMEYGTIHICGSYIAGIFNNDISENSEGTIKFETLRFRGDSRTDANPSFVVLSCEGHEWYMGINIKDGKVYGFDAIAKEYVEQHSFFSEYLNEFLKALA